MMANVTQNARGLTGIVNQLNTARLPLEVSNSEFPMVCNVVGS